MKSIVITFVTIFFGISIAVPINKDHNIDDLVLRVNELRKLSPYQGRIHEKYLLNNGVDNTLHRGKRALELDRNPTLYGYYSGVLNNIYDKRDALDYSSNNNNNLDEAYGKRNFDEIDRALIGGLKKRLFSFRLPRFLSNYDNNNNNPIDISSKRNFDEIDRAGFTTLKRNGFDEIDRAGFVGLKRSYLNGIPLNSIRNPSLTSATSQSSINGE